MNKFNLYETHRQYFTPEIVSLITQLYFKKGRQNFFIEQHENQLDCLCRISAIQGTAASNRLSGINVPENRVKELMNRKTEPEKHSEEEISGYAHVRQSIEKNFDYIPCKPYYLMQLHRDLYLFNKTEIGGIYKADADFDVEKAMDELFDSYNSALEHKDAEPLILIPMMMLNFLAIEPFAHGNERMSRLLVYLELCKNEFLVAKYVSLEVIIEKTISGFKESKNNSFTAWLDNVDDYEAFIHYFLKIMDRIFRDFEEKTSHFLANNSSKPQIIENHISRLTGKFTKKQLMEFFPDISEITIERTLSSLCSKGKITRQGSSRGTFYEKGYL